MQIRISDLQNRCNWHVLRGACIMRYTLCTRARMFVCVLHSLPSDFLCCIVYPVPPLTFRIYLKSEHFFFFLTLCLFFLCVGSGVLHFPISLAF